MNVFMHLIHDYNKENIVKIIHSFRFQKQNLKKNSVWLLKQEHKHAYVKSLTYNRNYIMLF